MNKIRTMAAALLLFSQMTMAGVMVESSRVVFQATDSERSLVLSNTNDYPVIVQAWVDDGAPGGTPEKAVNSPVMPLPGIFRLETGEKKFLRLLSTQQNLPADRESLYWLNLYEIPPTDAHLPPGVSAVKIAVRLQLKLFYRPADLTPAAEDAPGKLQFHLVRQPGTLAVQVDNPTPYYLTFSSADVSDGAKSVPLAIGMLEPFTSKVLPWDATRAGQPKSIHYMLINDDGNGIEKRSTF